jgi:hypothetical protein
MPAAWRRSEDGPLDAGRLNFDHDRVIWTPHGSMTPDLDLALGELEAITVWPFFMRLGSEVDIDTATSSRGCVQGRQPRRWRPRAMSRSFHLESWKTLDRLVQESTEPALGVESGSALCAVRARG